MKKAYDLTPEQMALVHQYKPYALRCVRDVKRAMPGLADDFHSAALVGLADCASRWDSSKSQFKTYLAKRINFNIRDVMREGLKDKDRFCSLEAVAENGRMQCDALIDKLSYRPIEEADASEVVGWLKQPLPNRLKQLCDLMYTQGKSQAEAAAIMGLSKSRVSYLHQEALDLMKERYEWAQGEQKAA